MPDSEQPVVFKGGDTKEGREGRQAETEWAFKADKELSSIRRRLEDVLDQTNRFSAQWDEAKSIVGTPEELRKYLAQIEHIQGIVVEDAERARELVRSHPSAVSELLVMDAWVKKELQRVNEEITERVRAADAELLQGLKNVPTPPKLSELYKPNEYRLEGMEQEDESEPQPEMDGERYENALERSAFDLLQIKAFLISPRGRDADARRVLSEETERIRNHLIELDKKAGSPESAYRGDLERIIDEIHTTLAELEQEEASQTQPGAATEQIPEEVPQEPPAAREDLPVVEATADDDEAPIVVEPLPEDDNEEGGPVPTAQQELERRRSAAYDEKLVSLRTMKEQGQEALYEGAVNQLRQVLEGDEDVRHQFYFGWADEDIRALLNELGESQERPVAAAVARAPKDNSFAIGMPRVPVPPYASGTQTEPVTHVTRPAPVPMTRLAGTPPVAPDARFTRLMRELGQQRSSVVHLSRLLRSRDRQLSDVRAQLAAKPAVPETEPVRTEQRPRSGLATFIDAWNRTAVQDSQHLPARRFCERLAEQLGPDRSPRDATLDDMMTTARLVMEEHGAYKGVKTRALNREFRERQALIEALMA